MALFESYERREKQILAVIKEYGINSIEECAEICKDKGLDIYKLVEGIQPICFENAKWAYTVGCAIAIKKELHKSCGRCCCYRRRSSGFLYSRFCCRSEKSWSWTR